MNLGSLKIRLPAGGRAAKTAAGMAAALLLIVVFFSVAGTALAEDVEVVSAAVAMPKPLGSVTLQSLIGRIIKAFLGFAGVISLLMFIYGGLTWMLASGNEEKISSAKKTVVWSTLGLIIIFSSYLIANVIITALTEPTMKATPPAQTAAPAANPNP